jgi:hypothetical protein
MTTLKLDAFVYPTWSNPPAIIGDVRQNLAGDNSQLYSPTTGFPSDHRADGFHTRRHATRWPDDLWPSLGRRPLVRIRLCVRTSNTPSQASADHAATGILIQIFNWPISDVVFFDLYA